MSFRAAPNLAVVVRELALSAGELESDPVYGHSGVARFSGPPATGTTEGYAFLSRNVLKNSQPSRQRRRKTSLSSSIVFKMRRMGRGRRK